MSTPGGPTPVTRLYNYQQSSTSSDTTPTSYSQVIDGLTATTATTSTTTTSTPFHPPTYAALPSFPTHTFHDSAPSSSSSTTCSGTSPVGLTSCLFHLDQTSLTTLHVSLYSSAFEYFITSLHACLISSKLVTLKATEMIPPPPTQPAVKQSASMSFLEMYQKEYGIPKEVHGGIPTHLTKLPTLEKYLIFEAIHMATPSTQTSQTEAKVDESDPKAQQEEDSARLSTLSSYLQPKYSSNYASDSQSSSDALPFSAQSFVSAPALHEDMLRDMITNCASMGTRTSSSLAYQYPSTTHTLTDNKPTISGRIQIHYFKPEVKPVTIIDHTANETPQTSTTANSRVHRRTPTEVVIVDGNKHLLARIIYF